MVKFAVDVQVDVWQRNYYSNIMSFEAQELRLEYLFITTVSLSQRAFTSCGRGSCSRPSCGLECISVGLVNISLSSVELSSMSLLRVSISNSNCLLELVSKHKSSLHLVRSGQGTSLSSAGCGGNVFNLLEELTD